MSNRRKVNPAAAAMALGRAYDGQPHVGDGQLIEDAFGGDLALLVHCLKGDQATTIVIGVESWAHAAACMGSPFFTDDMSLDRKLFEVVPMRDAPHVVNPLGKDAGLSE